MINAGLVTAKLATAVEAACLRVTLAQPGRSEWVMSQQANAAKQLDRYLNDQGGHDLSEQNLIELFDGVGR